MSLKINYPNASDHILSDRRRPGGDIFIHGSCVTIGCVPLRDDPIEEIYLAAVDARTSGQARIPVHIFPGRMQAAQTEAGSLGLAQSRFAGLLAKLAGRIHLFRNQAPPAQNHGRQQRQIPFQRSV